MMDYDSDKVDISEFFDKYREFGIRKIDLLRSITALNYKFGLKAKVL
jgi:hypothetical protein